MQFLVRFCGYTDAESDNVRRAIAKKKGTEQLLPEIKRRFIEYCPQHYEITAEQCETVIEPFIQIILDASDYGFSWNHSDSYSATGYICGYLRYYHPLEFLTAALNIFGDDLEKTAAITRYAERKAHIRVTMPKWGLSRGNYVCDHEKNVIAKGLSSVKFMNAAIADELYELSKSRKYESFMDLLTDIDQKTSLNARQLEILIKLDFFSDFGNQRELLRLADLFAGVFKRGQVKQIKKSMVDGTTLEPIIRRYATGTTKSGGVAKSYTLLDVPAAMRETEQALMAVHMEDLSDRIKIQNFYDVMGYVGYSTGKPEDRRKLYVLRVKPAVRKRDGKQFGVNVNTRSLGSGVEGWFTIYNRVYDKQPVHDGDLIKLISYERERGGYFRMDRYERLV